MAGIGMHIILSLPNGTECTAELDQLYSEFKPACNKNTRHIAGMKMLAWVDARKNAKGEDKVQSHLQDLEEFLLGDDDENGVEGDPDDVAEDGQIIPVSVGNSVCNVNITNKDLAAIVNGYPEDPIELRPFDLYLTREKIIKYWITCGFLPMTRNALNNPKVRYELGEGGAPQEAGERMELLVKDYEELRESLGNLGFNSGVLDLKAREVVPREFPPDEEAAIQALLDNKSMNRAGGLFNIGCHVANSRVVLEAGRRLAVIEKEKKAKIDKKKKMTKRRMLKLPWYFMKNGRQMANNKTKSIRDQNFRRIQPDLL